jgi:hypothetical protein
MICRIWSERIKRGDADGEERGVPRTIETRECGAQTFGFGEQCIVGDTNGVHENGTRERRTKSKLILDGWRRESPGALRPKGVDAKIRQDAEEYLFNQESADFAVPLASSPDNEEIPEIRQRIIQGGLWLRTRLVHSISMSYCH